MTADGGRSHLSRRAFLAGGLAAAFASACGRKAREGEPGGTAAASSTASGLGYFPAADGAWASVDASAAGWDPAGLDAAATFAEAHNSTALVMLAGGRILAERYWRTWDEHTTGDIASAQKSIVSLLTGIAQEEGLLKISDRVGDHVGRGWSKAPAAKEDAITIRHLLTMTSGLDDRLEYVADAGTVWSYNNSAYHVVKQPIEKRAGMSFADYCARKIFEPIGVKDSSWTQRLLADAATGQHFTGLHASARDMGRLGLLVLRNGNWAGRQVIKDNAYLRDSLNTSQDLNESYGYLWWLAGKATHVVPGGRNRRPGSLIPSAPPDTVCALGAGDKKIYVCPSLDLVVARHGPAAGASEAGPSGFDEDLWQRIVAASPRR